MDGVAVPFKGFPAEALDFFEGLEADNSKAYWQEHKDVYERCVRGPMEALLAELGAEHGWGEAKLFRPYRDVRFSRDKSPYKTNIGATMAAGPYVALSAQGLSAGAGYYMMGNDQLERYRRAVDADASGKELEGIVAAARAKGLEVSSYDALKTAPKGYAKDHPRIELLRYKGLITWRSWPVEPWLGTAKAKGRIAAFWEQSRPLQSWLDDHVGHAAEARPER